MAAENKERMALLVGCGIAFAIIAFAALANYSGNSSSVRSIYTNLLEKKKVLEHLRSDLFESVEMEKTAVMALNDQDSWKFADQSRAAAARVEANLGTLRTLIAARSVPTEKELLEEFAGCWSELSKIDQRILPLAVENTNLKAAQLSREQGGASMQRFEQALESLRLAAAGKEHQQQIDDESSRALIAGLKLFNLQSPHIAEAEDTGMDALETRMQAEREIVLRSLARLGTFVDTENEVPLARANAAFTDFLAVNDQVVRLSRLNSNIKSLELSMGRKRLLVATCTDALATLQESMLTNISKATK